MSAHAVTVLVFDDILVHHRDFFEGLPGVFVYVAHANDCVNTVRRVSPDLVLMDYSMGPGLTGAQAVSALREVWAAKTLPIIGISSEARCNDWMVLAGANAGAAKMGCHDLVRTWISRLTGHDTGEPV